MKSSSLTREATSLLLSQFSESTKLKALIHSLVEPLEEALEAIESLRLSLYIDKASGEVLDTIGTILNQPRNNLGDADYGAWLKVRILLNNNSGTAEDIKRILSVLYAGIGGFELRESAGYLNVFLQKEPTFTTMKVIQAIIKEAVPMSVRTTVQVGISKPKGEK